MRLPAAAAVALLLAAVGCSSTVDSWMNTQTERLTTAGVTFPPEQGRNTVINMTSACVIKKLNQA